MNAQERKYWLTEFRRASWRLGLHKTPGTSEHTEALALYQVSFDTLWRGGMSASELLRYANEQVKNMQEDGR